MAIETKLIEYKDGDDVLEAYLAWDTEQTGPRPGVLVAHAWAGRDEFACDKAKEMAKLGYVGFALDMYGKGVLGNGPEENMKLMTPFVEDRGKMQERMKKALEVAQAQEEIDGSKMGAIGFCFGGMCVLDLARTGADIKGVVSFHGLLGQPGNVEAGKISAKVLVLHGFKDGMSSPEDLLAIQKELAQSDCDWQTHCYGQALHAFTNPEANNTELGLIYNEKIAQRAWDSAAAFLKEDLG